MRTSGRWRTTLPDSIRPTTQLGRPSHKFSVAHVTSAVLPSEGQRLFEQACGACHHTGDGPQTLGLNIPLALSTKMNSPNTANLERIILEGVANPVHREVGFMAAFGKALDDRQVQLLVERLRSGAVASAATGREGRRTGPVWAWRQSLN